MPVDTRKHQSRRKWQDPFRRLPTLADQVQQAIKKYSPKQAALQFFAGVLPKKHSCGTLSRLKFSPAFFRLTERINLGIRLLSVGHRS
jgi:hypothetical protein